MDEQSREFLNEPNKAAQERAVQGQAAPVINTPLKLTLRERLRRWRERRQNERHRKEQIRLGLVDVWRWVNNTMRLQKGLRSDLDQVVMANQANAQAQGKTSIELKRLEQHLGLDRVYTSPSDYYLKAMPRAQRRAAGSNGGSSATARARRSGTSRTR
jgi:phosphoglycolate phosphatase-like HAD superfamily hydrolase